MRRLAAAVVALLPALAAAQGLDGAASRPEHTYVFASAGTALALSDYLDGLGFDHGPAVEAGVGLRVARHVAVEASAGWFRLADQRSQWMRLGADPDDPVGLIEAERALSGIPVLAGLRISTGWWKLELFGLAGAGACLTALDVTTRGGVTGASSYSLTDTAFAVRLGAGVSASVARDVALGIEATYLRVGASLRLEGGPTTVTPPGEIRARLDSLVLSAKLAYQL